MTSARTLAKRWLGWPARLGRGARGTRRRRVLTFHEVGEHPWATPPDRFEAILAAVVRHARPVPLEDLLAGPDDGPLRVAVTFDDAYVGVARHAAPALARLGVPATLFVPTDVLRDDDGPAPADRGLYPGAAVLGWRSVASLAAAPLWRVESHGASHAALPSLDPATRAADLARSRAAIQARTGRAPTLLAYPHGAADAATARAARDGGFAAAFTTRHGWLAADRDPCLLPRCDVRGDYGPSDVVAILRGDWDALAAWQARRGGEP